jgi:hypothetical protein
MADDLTSFLAKHDWAMLKAIKGWQIERDDVDLNIIRLTLPARDGERFILRCICDKYPDLAPRVAFVNAQGSTSDLTAWPKGNAAFYEVVKLPPHSFLCTDLTREGFTHHPEWMNSLTAWKVSTHTLMNLFNYVQDDLLDSLNYLGRT